MILNDLKIAWRNLWKNKTFSILNILGLTLGFTGFILSYQYINRETSYDRWNPKFDDIYQIGLELNGQYSIETVPSMAPMIKDNFPEVELAGRYMVYPFGGYPISGESTIYIKNGAILDSAAAEIFQVQSINGPIFKSKEQKEATLINERDAKLLFKAEDLQFLEPKIIPMLPLNLGLKETINGIIKERPPSLINQDAIFIRDIADEKAAGNPFTYQTFIQVRKGTNIQALKDKINALYLSEIATYDKIKSTSFSKGNIYLEPLANIHLMPKAGSNTGYLIIWIIGILSAIILILASANFANMIMAQADHRVKELAIKKILGSSRAAIIGQLLIEVFILTLLSAFLSLIALAISGNVLQKWFNDDLIHYIFSVQTIIQLVLALVTTTLLSGIYPALVLSGYKSIYLLKGGATKTIKNFTFRNALLTFQVIFAIIFIVGMFVVQQQVKFIQNTDKGFEPEQIINFNGIGLYFNSAMDGNFEDFKKRLINDPSIVSASSPTNVPGFGERPMKMEFFSNTTKHDLEHIGIDPRYFETLNIEKIAGDDHISLSQILKDSLSNYAVINETAAKSLGLTNPIGSRISGCNVNFNIIAVVKDSKAYGFEEKVAPTVYSYKNECAAGRMKITLMVKAAPGMVDQAIKVVEKEWQKNEYSQDLPLDYKFMDQQYAALHAKQVEMQSAFNIFSIISVIIASLGLFSMSAYQVTLKRKEMSVRKVLGASVKSIFIQLNKPFIKIFIIASIIAIPLAFLLIRGWLNNFAYHISIQWWYFGLALILVLLIILLTISYQSIQAAKENPVDSLRDE